MVHGASIHLDTVDLAEGWQGHCCDQGFYFFEGNNSLAGVYSHLLAPLPVEPNNAALSDAQSKERALLGQNSQGRSRDGTNLDWVAPLQCINQAEKSVVTIHEAILVKSSIIIPNNTNSLLSRIFFPLKYSPRVPVSTSQLLLLCGD